MKNRTSAVVYIYIIVAVILWGISFVWTNSLLQMNVPILTFTFMRMAVAGVVLSLASLALRKLQKINRKDIKWFLLLALCEPFIYFLGETYGLKATGSPALSSVIIATIPVLTLVAGQIFYKEKISLWNTIGIFMTIPGIFMMAYRGEGFSAEYSWGIALLFVAVFSATGYSSVVRRLTDKYNDYTITTVQFLLGALYFLPLVLIFDRNLISADLVSWRVLYPVCSLAVLCSATCFLLYVRTIRSLGITKTAIFTSMIPAFSALSSYLAGYDTFTPMQIMGIAVVVAGVILTQKPSSK